MQGCHGKASQVGTIQSQVGTVQSQVGTVQSHVGMVRSRISTVQSWVGMVQSRVGMVQSRVGTVQSQGTAFQFKIYMLTISRRYGNILGRYCTIQKYSGSRHVQDVSSPKQY